MRAGDLRPLRHNLRLGAEKLDINIVTLIRRIQKLKGFLILVGERLGTDHLRIFQSAAEFARHQTKSFVRHSRHRRLHDRVLRQ